jgi:hypothetical protein
LTQDSVRNNTVALCSDLRDRKASSAARDPKQLLTNVPYRSYASRTRFAHLLFDTATGRRRDPFLSRRGGRLGGARARPYHLPGGSLSHLALYRHLAPADNSIFPPLLSNGTPPISTPTTNPPSSAQPLPSTRRLYPLLDHPLRPPHRHRPSICQKESRSLSLSLS